MKVRTFFGNLPTRGTGPLRTSAVELQRMENVLNETNHGLQMMTTGAFDDMVIGTFPEMSGKYLWTIDKRGINIAEELTPFPTPRGNIVHSNLSHTASIGGEAWFESAHTVILNANSGRFGDRAGITKK